MAKSKFEPTGEKLEEIYKLAALFHRAHKIADLNKLIKLCKPTKEVTYTEASLFLTVISSIIQRYVGDMKLKTVMTKAMGARLKSMITPELFEKISSGNGVSMNLGTVIKKLCEDEKFDLSGALKPTVKKMNKWVKTIPIETTKAERKRQREVVFAKDIEAINDVLTSSLPWLSSFIGKQPKTSTTKTRVAKKAEEKFVASDELVEMMAKFVISTKPSSDMSDASTSSSHKERKHKHKHKSSGDHKKKSKSKH